MDAGLNMMAGAKTSRCRTAPASRYLSRRSSQNPGHTAPISAAC